MPAGDLIHVDIKKLGRIPPGGGWRVNGRETENLGGKRRRKIGHSFVHSAVDDHSRLAYSEVLDDERKGTTAEFWLRAQEFFLDNGIVVKSVRGQFPVRGFGHQKYAPLAVMFNPM